jgi:hypothetical protein
MNEAAGKMNETLKASPYKRHKIAAGGSLCCSAGWTHPR